MLYYPADIIIQGAIVRDRDRNKTSTKCLKENSLMSILKQATEVNESVP